MASLGLITPCLPEIGDFLQETGAEVVRLLRHPRHRISWTIVVDGPGELADVPDDPAVHVLKCERHCGTATARNIGLWATDAEWVMPLDADDLVNPAAIARVLDRLSPDGESMWVGGNIELLDGRRAPHHFSAAASIGVRELEQAWTAPFRFYPNAIIALRRAVLAVGGWPAVPAAEDLGLALRLNGEFRGELIPEIFFRYRYSRRQTTRNRYLAPKVLSFDLLAQSINVQRRALGLPEIRPPDLLASARPDGTPSYWPEMLPDT